MELLLRVEGCEPPSTIRDVVVTVESFHTAGELCAALSGACLNGQSDVCLRRSDGTVLDAEATIEQSSIVSGEVLTLAPRDAFSTHRTQGRQGVRLSVLAGPDGGRQETLAPGTYSVGRGPDADIRFGDRQTSKIHAHILVAADLTVRLVPAEQVVNPTLLNGEPLTREATIEAGDRVQVGANIVSVERYRPRTRQHRDLLGQIPFHRTPYRPAPVEAQIFEPVGNVPSENDPRSFSLVSALVPLVGGVMMAVLFRDPRFLLLTALSPISAGASFLQTKRDSTKRHTRSVQRFRRRAEERAVKVHAALEEERRRRNLAAPDLANLTHRALDRTRLLWVRGRDAPDFLTLRIGTGQVPAAVEVRFDEGGDEALCDEVRMALDGAETLESAPVALSLADVGSCAVLGPVATATAVVSALVLQAVCLHSPDDLVVAAAVAPDRQIGDWLKWTPHSRSSASPIAGPHIRTDKVGADHLARRLLEVAETRLGAEGRDVDRRWPWLLAIFDRRLEPDASLISTLLEHAPAAGISVIWVTDDESRVPRQIKRVVRCRPERGMRSSLLWSSDPAVVERQPLEVEQAPREVAEQTALALAPLRDASSGSATGAIPRVASLFSALGVDDLSSAWVKEQWLTPKPYSLVAPVGVSVDGPFKLDLVEHGPHGLIGGTSGSGKSELVQAIVAGLIATNPPTHLNLLFVDYKGGAAADAFSELPHTVGRVTNLDGALAHRALVSLKAELNRRMDILSGKAKDIAQMWERHPREAPPSLVIIVDEFATLVKEIPDFIDGIVDIAQRGRSLGIHLLLSTQRPTGAVNDNILANTNLRISLRMLDGAESASIIDTPDAVTIPPPLKGRALARLGPGELIPFQSAFTGSPLPDQTGRPSIAVDLFKADAPLPSATAGPDPEGRSSDISQLHLLIDSVLSAAAELNMGKGRQPWCDELSRSIGLDEVREQVRTAKHETIPGRTVALGMVDDPAKQQQYPAVIDLESGGGLVIIGSGGSGKSTALRTIATSAALDDAESGGGGLTIFGLDFSSGGLTSLRRLPQCAAVATWDDLESVTRILTLLDHVLGERRHTNAAATSEEQGVWRGDRLLLLIDGFAGLVQTFDTEKMYSWVENLQRLVIDGRQVGIHVVITADRRASVRTSLMAAFANRLVLRQADEDGYLDAGIPHAISRGVQLSPGRGFLNTGLTVQVATSPSGEHVIGPDPVHVAPELPERLPLEPRPADEFVVYLGKADVTPEVVMCDLSTLDMLVTGPPGSGRTTALATLARQLAMGGAEVWLAGPDDSPLAGLDVGQRVFGNSTEVTGGLKILEDALQDVPVQRDFDQNRRRVLLFDDADQFDEQSIVSQLKTLSSRKDLRVIVTASATTTLVGASMFVSDFQRRVRSRLLLQPTSNQEVHSLFPHLGIELRPGLAMPPGRGIFVQGAVAAQVVQVADGLRLSVDGSAP